MLGGTRWQSSGAAWGHWGLRLHARPEYVPLLRERVRAWLKVTSASKRDAFEVLLATTEAFVNAVEHPHKPTSRVVDVEGSRTVDCVTISIRDYGSWQSQQARKNQGGLGLALMEDLMDTVQVERGLDGTIVTMHRRLAR
jgi:anti-sigma regulatory factor (Ser/Thr protein kinase)